MRKIYTNRLILRGFEESDLDALYEFGKSENVGPNAGWKPYESRRAAEVMLRAFTGQDEFWAVALAENNKLIGNIGLHLDEKRSIDNVRMLGYALAEEHWGKGYATEAGFAVLKHGFERLRLDIISAYHYPDNLRSEKVIKKLGFKFEGTMRMGSTRWNGEPTDDCCYSITKKEYIEQRFIKL